VIETLSGALDARPIPLFHFQSSAMSVPLHIREKSKPLGFQYYESMVCPLCTES
jgi:hypothetical protein